MNTPFLENFSVKFTDIYCRHISGVTRTDVGISTRSRWLIFSFNLIATRQVDVIYVLLNSSGIEIEILLNCGAIKCKVTDTGILWDSLPLAVLLSKQEKLSIESAAARLFLLAQENRNFLRVLLSEIRVVSNKEAQS